MMPTVSSQSKKKKGIHEISPFFQIWKYKRHNCEQKVGLTVIAKKIIYTQ